MFYRVKSLCKVTYFTWIIRLKKSYHLKVFLKLRKKDRVVIFD